MNVVLSNGGAQTCTNINGVIRVLVVLSNDGLNCTCILSIYY